MDSRPLYRRALGAAFVYSVKTVRRVRKGAKRMRRHLYSRARYTSLGRALLAMFSLVASPRGAFERRRAVAAYNRRFPSQQLDRTEGYTMLPAGSLPGTSDIVPVCVGLFEEKKRQIEGGSTTGDGPANKKRAFLRSVLTNQDLEQHPELLDFALSDRLLSLVTNYLNTIPHLNRIDLLYSVDHGGDEAVSSQMFHLDPEGRRQAKLFLNLRDVGPEEGPFTFIPASESARIVTSIRAQRQAEGELAMARYLDREIAHVGGLDKAIGTLGPPGSAALVDTSRCLHFGSRVKPGTYRLCLYIQYCSSPEHGNRFDVSRHRADPVRYLALVASQRSAPADVSAPHQMG